MLQESRNNHLWQQDCIRPVFSFRKSSAGRPGTHFYQDHEKSSQDEDAISSDMGGLDCLWKRSQPCGPNPYDLCTIGWAPEDPTRGQRLRSQAAQTRCHGYAELLEKPRATGCLLAESLKSATAGGHIGPSSLQAAGESDHGQNVR